jgi:hypothetical protein
VYTHTRMRHAYVCGVRVRGYLCSLFITHIADLTNCINSRSMGDEAGLVLLFICLLWPAGRCHLPGCPRFHLLAREHYVRVDWLCDPVSNNMTDFAFP